MASILTRTRIFLSTEAVVGLAEASGFSCDINDLRLCGVTAIAGLGEGIGLLIAFSFDQGLLDALFERFAAGLDIAEDEVALYRRETAAEVANTILGQCTSDLQDGEGTIDLSPPQVIECERSIRRPKHAVFAAMSIGTDRGGLEVKLIGPRDLFDERLNFRH